MQAIYDMDAIDLYWVERPEVTQVYVNYGPLYEFIYKFLIFRSN